LIRPSSPPTAKASTVYAYSLNHTTQTGLAWSLLLMLPCFLFLLGYITRYAPSDKNISGVA
ncbi:hypothetical protein, partial [Pseudoalteromonas nigrifaciens]|uniref:hypothetical protein n=1 Tax=Pseudoalteromonas nigrifaciens TaxID=28109 RepID=UPI001CE3FC7C